LKKCISDDFEALSFEDFNALCVYTASLSFLMKLKAIAAEIENVAGPSNN
jgi:hypothetical protein